MKRPGVFPLQPSYFYLSERRNFLTELIIKITISSIVIGLKNSYFFTNSLAKLLSDSLLLDVRVIDQVWGQDGWILAKLFFCVFMDRDEIEVNKLAKKERGQYPAICLTMANLFFSFLYSVFSGVESPVKKKWQYVFSTIK